MNILIKLMSIVSLVIAPYIAVEGGHQAKTDCSSVHGQKTECCAPGAKMDMGNCDMEKCMNMSEEECAAYCDSMQCTPEQKEACLGMIKAHKGMSMENCDKGCKSEEACTKSCDDKCVASHKENKGCCKTGESNHCDPHHKKM